MRPLWLLPVLALALLASPLAAVLCAAGACAAEAAVESHCAMAREDAGTAVAAARIECCTDVAPLDPATAAHGPQVVAWPAAGGTAATPAPPAVPAANEPQAAVARSGPNERLHRLGALLL